jgi:hypothetical protein
MIIFFIYYSKQDVMINVNICYFICNIFQKLAVMSLDDFIAKFDPDSFLSLCIIKDDLNSLLQFLQ